MSMEPFVLDETEDFAVIYKPPRMHSVYKSIREQLRQGAGDTLFDWYLQRSFRPAEVFPPVKGFSGGKEGDTFQRTGGGLLHRLDYETQGLMLFAKNQQSLDHLLRQQDKGKFIKEYNAICQKADVPSSFPPPPFSVLNDDLPQTPFFIESFFRPFGPGRKQVRPVLGPLQSVKAKRNRKTASDQGRFYRTEITGIFETEVPGRYSVTARIYRGFRHQIRCHLAWIGCPVLNDPLYGQEGQSADGFLALRAIGLSFTGPDGKQHEYRLN